MKNGNDGKDSGRRAKEERKRQVRAWQRQQAAQGQAAGSGERRAEAKAEERRADAKSEAGPPGNGTKIAAAVVLAIVAVVVLAAVFGELGPGACIAGGCGARAIRGGGGWCDLHTAVQRMFR